MYSFARANADSQRMHYERSGKLDVEVVFTPLVGLPRIVCLASYEDAQLIVKALRDVASA